jgi:Uma2 family endonuclease
MMVQMTVASTKTRFMPQDLLDMDGDGLFELVDGELVEKEMSSLANRTAVIISTRLLNFNEQAKSGNVVYAEQSFQCFAHDPDLVRRPDVALIVASRLAAVPEEGHIPIAPDLVVEVISPNDKIYKFERKLADYREAAIPLVWEVNPKFRFIRVHYVDRAPHRLGETEILTAEPVLSGFSVLVKELLPPLSGHSIP